MNSKNISAAFIMGILLCIGLALLGYFIVRKTMERLVELGKHGIAISGEDYQSKSAFMFTKLNDLKPVMIEEATKNARAVAEKFAQYSKSRIGKIKSASQGQFSMI